MKNTSETPSGKSTVTVAVKLDVDFNVVVPYPKLNFGCFVVHCLKLKVNVLKYASLIEILLSLFFVTGQSVTELVCLLAAPKVIVTSSSLTIVALIVFAA